MKKLTELFSRKSKKSKSDDADTLTSDIIERKRLIAEMKQRHPDYRGSKEYLKTGIPQGRHEFLIEARRRNVKSIRTIPTYWPDKHHHYFGIRLEGYDEDDKNILNMESILHTLGRSPQGYLMLSFTVTELHKQSLREKAYEFYKHEGFDVSIESRDIYLPDELGSCVFGTITPRIETYDGERIAIEQ